MSRPNAYYTLVASLPLLPRFDRAERLPISRERLAERLRMLAPQDAATLEQVTALFAWERQALERTDAEVATDYERLMAEVRHPMLRTLLESIADQRTILAALRRRRRGLPAPAPGEPWGVGPLAAPIARQWEAPDLGLGRRYPWVPDARALLHAGESLALERLLVERNWELADRLLAGTEFGFDAVLGYLVKWNMLQMWLSHDSRAARERFEELVTEMLNDKEEGIEEGGAGGGK